MDIRPSPPSVDDRHTPSDGNPTSLESTKTSRCAIQQASPPRRVCRKWVPRHSSHDHPGHRRSRSGHVHQVSKRQRSLPGVRGCVSVCARESPNALSMLRQLPIWRQETQLFPEERYPEEMVQSRSGTPSGGGSGTRGLQSRRPESGQPRQRAAHPTRQRFPTHALPRNPRTDESPARAPTRGSIPTASLKSASLPGHPPRPGRPPRTGRLGDRPRPHPRDHRRLSREYVGPYSSSSPYHSQPTNRSTAIAFSKPYLTPRTTTTDAQLAVPVCDGVAFRVDTIQPGAVLQLAAEPDQTRLCSVAAGKVRVRMGEEAEFLVGPHGLFKVKAGVAGEVRNGLYLAAVVHTVVLGGGL